MTLHQRNLAKAISIIVFEYTGWPYRHRESNERAMWNILFPSYIALLGNVMYQLVPTWLPDCWLSLCCYLLSFDGQTNRCLWKLSEAVYVMFTLSYAEDEPIYIYIGTVYWWGSNVPEQYIQVYVPCSSAFYTGLLTSIDLVLFFPFNFSPL